MSTYAQISDFFPGPYLCYHTTNTMEKVEEAMKYVGEVVEDEGAFCESFNKGEDARG